MDGGETDHPEGHRERERNEGCSGLRESERSLSSSFTFGTSSKRVLVAGKIRRTGAKESKIKVWRTVTFSCKEQSAERLNHEKKTELFFDRDICKTGRSSCKSYQ